MKSRSISIERSCARVRGLRAGLLGIALLALCGGTAGAQAYKDANAATEARVRDLLSRMTLEEKFWQLFMLSTPLEGIVEKCASGAFGFQMSTSGDAAGSVSRANAIQRRFVERTRLGIPVIFFDEAVHGLVHADAIVFPQAIALAASFDTALVHRVSSAIALDCRRHGIRQVLSPVVNVAADVRWGRVEETYGEDPYLSSAMGVAFVTGLEKRGVITTPKHFLANVGDGGRDSYPIHDSERSLREIYLPPFEACIRRGGSRSIMTAYNSIDGIPCSANDWLLNRLLKEEMGFDGFVVSDAGAVGGANALHLTARDYAEATEHALSGGLDVIFQTSYDHYPLFIEAFRKGRIEPATIDQAVSRVLRAKFELGLFERPYVDSTEWAPGAGAAERIELAREASRRSIVLLKNVGNLLPLRKSLKTIAVFGQDATETRLGGYSGPGTRRVSILDGIRNKLGPSARVLHAKGCGRAPADYVTVPSACLLHSRGETFARGLLGEYFDNVALAGPPVFTRVDPEIRFQWTLYSPDPSKLPNHFYSVRWTGRLKAPATGAFRIGIDGNDGYRLFIDDTLAIDNWTKLGRRALLVERRFEKNREYDLRIEFFEPTGNAWFNLVWNVGVPTDGTADLTAAAQLARESDVAVVVAGIEEGEFRDRAKLGLPGRQEELIERIAATGTPVVVIIVGGSAVTMSGWLGNVPAVLDVWYPGEQGGNAVADVLFGDCNPAGRLPVTFPVAEGQLPLVYNHRPTGRGDDYVDMTGQPLFPFGFGLSYTTFDYGDLSFDRKRIDTTDSAVVRCTVRNTGTMAGDEVVQLYIHDETASIARPVMELKGFARIHLKPGETKETRFTITSETLRMLDGNLEPVVEPGDFRVMIGSSSRDIRLEGTLTVVGRAAPAAPVDTSGAANGLVDRILVEKSKRTMTLIRRGRKVAEYKIALGSNPVGPKVMKGDNKTPEGLYFIDSKIRKSVYYRALHITYPNRGDLMRADSLGVSPGGGIMIHGMSKKQLWMGDVQYLFNWTEGCIALTNSEIDEIWDLIPLWTPVDIRP